MLYKYEHEITVIRSHMRQVKDTSEPTVLLYGSEHYCYTTYILVLNYTGARYIYRSYV